METDSDNQPLVSPGAARSLTSRRPAVLLVDDSLTVRRYHRRIAEAAGWAVAEAADGAEAIEIALSEAFDLMLVDVNMPTMDGYRFLAALRATPAIGDLPAIMISSEAAEEDRRQAFAAGANLYLVKPVEPERLGLILDVLRPAGCHE